MPTIADAIAHLTPKIDQSVSVGVARKQPDGTLDARKLSLAEDAAAAFRGLCRQAVESLPGRSVLSYDSDAELADNQVFLLDDAENLRELADLRALGPQVATLPVTPPMELDLSIKLYAVVVGDADRAVFVRRVDPHIKSKAGGFLGVAKQQLQRLEEPAFSFSPGFDVILTDAWALVMNQGAFERLFREIGLVERHVAEWVQGITDHLPMEPASVAALQQVALRDSRTWRKLREISRRGHLAHIGLADVTAYAERMRIDPTTVVRSGQLVFDPSKRFSFLHLLNEDIYRGPLTDERFEAQRKSPTGT